MTAPELRAIAAEIRRRYPEPVPGQILHIAERHVTLRALADILDSVATQEDA